MNEIKYIAIIVVYNKKIKDSITCSCIRKIHDINIEIMIVDNSDIDMCNKRDCDELGYKYISMNGNMGLSKAYNTALNLSSYSDVIILFDDDTNLTIEYFNVLDKAVRDNEDVDIFAPIIYGQDGVIYSPNSFNFLKNQFILSENQEVPQNCFNAIASCLAVRRRVFEDYRFNEILFVDQVDQYFFCEQRKLGRKFMKIDTAIYQNFYQRGEKLSAIAGWKRLRVRLIDVMRHAWLMGGIKFKMLGFVKCCGLSVQIAQKTKSVGVLVKGCGLSCKLLALFCMGIR